MLGFLTPNRLDLTIRQNQNYFHSQCGMCQQLKNDYGIMSRFLVNRDALMLQLLTESQMDTESIHCKIRCGVQPFLHSAKANPKAAEFAAAVTVMMFWGKLTDTVNDAKGFSSFFSRYIAKFLLSKNKRILEKAEKKLAELDFDVQVIYDLFEKQQKMEKSMDILKLDEAASPMSEGLSALFAHTAVLANHPEHFEILKILGREVGAILYVLDARNDLTADIKKGRFNPLKFYANVSNESTQLTEIERKATVYLNKTHQVVNGAFKSFKPRYHQEVLTNIFDSGLQNKIKQPTTVCSAKRNNKLSWLPGYSSAREWRGAHGAKIPQVNFEDDCYCCIWMDGCKKGCDDIVHCRCGCSDCCDDTENCVTDFFRCDEERVKDLCCPCRDFCFG